MIDNQNVLDKDEYIEVIDKVLGFLEKGYLPYSDQVLSDDIVDELDFLVNTLIDKMLKINIHEFSTNDYNGLAIILSITPSKTSQMLLDKILIECDSVEKSNFFYTLSRSLMDNAALSDSETLKKVYLLTNSKILLYLKQNKFSEMINVDTDFRLETGLFSELLQDDLEVRFTIIAKNKLYES